jgi:hypothetical protein
MFTTYPGVASKAPYIGGSWRKAPLSKSDPGSDLGAMERACKMQLVVS